MRLPVAVVIPMFNEAATLPSLFSALASQSAYPSELIFVDAGSVDGSPDMVTRWWESAGWGGATCQVFSQPGALPGAGRNIGIREAKNDWVAFLDAGIQPEPDWLQTIFNHAQTHRLQGVFGVSRFSAEAPVAKAICALSYGCGAIHPVLPASIFRREIFEQTGPFAAGLRAGEDLLWLHAYQSIYGPRAICWEAIVNYRYFPASIGRAAKKWFIYEMHVVAAGIGLRRKTAHMFFLVGVLASLLISLPFGLPLFFAYVIFRGVIGPIRRSADRPWWGRTFSSAGIAMACGPLLDIAKLGGYMAGTHRRLLGKNIPLSARNAGAENER